MNTRRNLGVLFFLAIVLPATAGLRLSPAIMELGEVLENTERESEFFVVNTGTEPVTIAKVKPTCGCTQASADGETVAPGDSLRVHFTFSSLGFSGRVKKAVLVIPAGGKELMFEFHAVVKNDLVLSPRRVTFRGLTLTASVKVENLSDRDAAITKVEYPERVIEYCDTTDLVGVVIPAHATVKLPVRVGFYPAARAGKYTWVRMRTDSERSPELRVFLYPWRFPWPVVIAGIACIGAAAGVLAARKRRRRA